MSVAPAVSDYPATAAPNRILRAADVRARVGNPSPVTLWRWTRAGEFPQPIRLGGNSVGWIESEVERWIRERAEARYLRDLPTAISVHGRRTAILCRSTESTAAV
jgi:prophage regulatory protein